MTKRRSGPMKGPGGGAYNETNAELENREAEVLLATTIDWERLRPQVGDNALYDQLIAEVSKATRKNESLAQLKNRLQALGEEGLKLAKKVVELLD